MITQVDRPRVAFQGERGAFSEEAAVKLLGKEIVLLPRPTFAALFKSLDEGVADFILAPIENSIAGPVDECQASIHIRSLSICGEVSLLITQNLIGCAGASLEKIATVESHPVALAQCRRFFGEHPMIMAIASHDTAGSVAQVVSRGDPTRAAIASRRAAEIYGGIILQEHLEDEPENYTRFVLLQTRDQSRGVSTTRERVG
jgi:prephenate dehydratase